MVPCGPADLTYRIHVIHFQDVAVAETRTQVAELTAVNLLPSGHKRRFLKVSFCWMNTHLSRTKKCMMCFLYIAWTNRATIYGEIYSLWFVLIWEKIDNMHANILFINKSSTANHLWISNIGTKSTTMNFQLIRNIGIRYIGFFLSYDGHFIRPVPWIQLQQVWTLHSLKNSKSKYHQFTDQDRCTVWIFFVFLKKKKKRKNLFNMKMNFKRLKNRTR